MKRYTKLISLALIVALLCAFTVSCNENENKPDNQILLLSSGVINLDKVDMTYQLEAISNSSENLELVWMSSAPQIATVNENGLVTAVSKGSAVVSATTPSGAVAYCTVHVLRSPPKLEEVFGMTINGLPLSAEYCDKETGKVICSYTINSFEVNECYIEDGAYFVQIKLKGVKTFDSEPDGTHPVILRIDLYNENGVFCETQLLKSESVGVGEEFEVLCNWFGVNIIENTVRNFEIRLWEKVEN